MALITIGTNLIDVADVALVAPRGAESTVYLADSQQLESALTAAAQAAAVNGTAAGALLTTVVVSSNYGSCYISGVNTQRVIEAGAGTIWYLRGGPGAVVCPSTDLATAQTLIGATSSGGSSAQGYTNRGVWTPNLTDPNATTTYSAPFAPAPWVRIGPAAANGPAAGDYVRCGMVVTFSGEVVGSQPVLVVSDLPFPPADAGAFSCAAMLIVDTQPGVAIGVASPPFGGQLFFQMQGVAVGMFSGVLALEVTIQVDAL